MIDDLVALSSERRFVRGETIVGQGDPSSPLYLVHKGFVSLSVISETGREAIVDLAGPGDVFGEHWIFEPRPCPYRARALSDCRLGIVARDSLHALLERRPDLSLALLRVVATRLQRTTESLQHALLHDVPTRVGKRLAALARDHGTLVEGGVLVRASITQEDLARMVGASRETVNKVIGRMTARGLIHMEGRVYVIPDPLALEAEQANGALRRDGNGDREAVV
ncbi:MAG: Crp/Fnr family transcriptional regulator [Actinomycetota bacterium]